MSVPATRWRQLSNPFLSFPIGSLAAGAQSGIGSVAAGSLFAGAQGAAMGAAIPASIHAIGGAITGVVGAIIAAFF